MERLIICYAWVIWCWKTPITNYISTKLWLPVFDTDAIRSEVREDLLVWDEDEVKNRANKRLNSIIKEWKAFIFDVSVDRTRWKIKEILLKNHYNYFLISIDLDKKTLSNFYKAKWYDESMQRIDNVYEDHQNFLKEFSDDINMHINERNYQNRLKNVYRVVSQWIKKFETEKNIK